MTLEEMKRKTYSLIEEYSEDADDLTEDEDLAAKMPFVINQIQNELCRLKKLPEYTTMEVKKGDVKTFNELADDLYQLNVIRDVDCEIIADRVMFEEDGVAKIFYFKYPKQINDETDDEYKFELSTDVLEIMPYGVAADLLKSDVSQQYGAIYRQRYEEMKATLDPRYGTGMIEFAGGIDV